MFRYCTLILILLLPAWSQAQDSDSARAIFEEVDLRRDRIVTETSRMQMTIYDSRGRARNREIRSFSRNGEDISRSLLIFEEPANVRGTAFLTLSEGSEEVQKLYLPALDRIRIISASEKSDRFMGSDFTYEDLGDREPEDYRFEMRAETDTAYVLHAVKQQESQYARLLFYVHPERYTVDRIDFFNERDEPIKRLRASRFREVMKGVWQADRMVMYDLRDDRRTVLTWTTRDIGASIPAWRFTDRGLRRGN